MHKNRLVLGRSYVRQSSDQSRRIDGADPAATGQCPETPPMPELANQAEHLITTCVGPTHRRSDPSLYTTVETPSASADGEQDGAASEATKAETDPVRLVRMVKEIDPLREVRPHSRRICFTYATSTWGSVFSRLPRFAIPSLSPTGRARWGRKKTCITTRRGARLQDRSLPCTSATMISPCLPSAIFHAAR